MHALDTREIEAHGLTFRVELFHDEDHGAPWDEEDGHGPVSDWQRVDGWGSWSSKRAGQRVLCADRGSFRFYDEAEAIRIARRDGWGLNDEDRAKLAAKLKREPTAREVTAEAVRLDFERMRAWCNGGWHYVGVVVTLLDIEGDPTHESDALWGIESDSDSYIEETAHELAANIAARYPQPRRLLMRETPARSTVITIRN
jgi:hypothetical protein